ncbi:MAG: ArsR family transcriptional regulator [Promethearchaeota archaeon]|nr:MAG: ArsR family transcriptional regulator [Candidatus Lokiarchaeota archaeon]
MLIINIERQEEIKKMLSCCKDYCSGYFQDLQTKGSELKIKEEFKNLETFFNALASKERLIIIETLKDQDRCVCELEAILDKSQSTISHHLRKLEKAELIYSFRKGNYTYYGLIKEKLNTYLKYLIKR